MAGKTLSVVAPAGILLLLLSACTVEKAISGRRDYSIDPTAQYREVTLAGLLARPGSYKGMEVEFAAMFNRRDETIWNHYYTPFVTDSYTSFSVWPAEAHVWTRDGYLRSVPTLYVRKDNPYLQEMLDAKAFSVVLVRGVVRTDYGDRPWIEVHRVLPRESPRFTAASLRNLVAGLEDVEKKRPAPAKEKLERALQGALSQEARYVALMLLGRLYEDSNDYVRGMQYYSQADDHTKDETKLAAAKEGYRRNEQLEAKRRQIEEMKEKEREKEKEKG